MHTSMNTETTLTTAQRARKRATQSRLRAHRKSELRYEVKNLNTGKLYHVWYNLHRSYPAWECTCLTNNRDYRCKHVQRVMDRKEHRIRVEALANG